MGWAYYDYRWGIFGFKGVKVIFSIKNEKARVKAALLIIVLIYAGLCGLYFWIHGNEGIRGSFESFDNDDVKYLRSAWTLLETGKYTYKNPQTDTVFIMPGITTVLAAFVAIFGKYPILQFKIFQAILGCACLYLIFLCGRRLFGTAAALVCTAMMALYFPSIYVTGTLLTECCFYFLFLLTFYYTIAAVESRKMKYYAMGGIFLGLSALFRPTVLAFPAAVFAVWIAKKYKFIDMIKFAGTVVGIVCLILSPWIIRNAIIFKQFIPLTKASGNPAFQGTFISYDRTTEEEENIDYYNIIKKETDIDVDKYGFDELVDDAVESEMARIRFREVIIKNPLKYLYWYTIGKTIKNFEEPFLWVVMFGIDIEWLRGQHYLLLLLGFLGFAGMAFSGRKNHIMKLPAYTVLLFNCVHLPFYCFSRYMFPFMFCFALYAAYLIAGLFALLKNNAILGLKQN